MNYIYGMAGLVHIRWTEIYSGVVYVIDNVMYENWHEY